MVELHWIGLLQCASGAAAVTLLLRYVFGYGRRERVAAFWAVLCTAAAAETALLFFARYDAETADLLQEMMILTCSVVFPYTLLRHGRKGTFFLFGLVYGATTDYIVALLPERQTDVICLVTDALFCLFALLMRKFGKIAPPDFLEQMPIWVYLTVFFVEWSAFYSGMLLRDASYFAGVSAVLKGLSLVLVGISVVLIIRRFLAAQRAEQEANAHLETQLRHYEQLIEKNRGIRAFRHDYANNLLSLGAILDAGETEDARAYVRHLRDDVESTAYDFVTGSYLADAILSDKAAHAGKGGIGISFIGSVPGKGIANPDLCTILCNLLDNAICGCGPCAPCTVELIGRETTDRWLLTVKNPVVQKVAIRGSVIRTSKADKENHGIGLANVRRAAEKYNGYLELQCNDNCFTAEVGLILKTGERK